MGDVASALSAVSGVAGLFGSKSKSRTLADNIGDLAGQTRIEAERWGWNPLTLLQAASGVSAGGGETSGASFGQRLADSATAVLDRKAREEQAQLENERLKLENDKLKKEAENATLRPSVPGIYQDNGSLAGAVGARGLSGGGFAAIPGSGGLDAAGNPLTAYVVGGNVVQPNASLSDAEIMETRIGDVGSSVYGLGVAAADTWQAVKPRLDGWAQRMGPRAAGALNSAVDYLRTDAERRSDRDAIKRDAARNRDAMRFHPFYHTNYGPFYRQTPDRPSKRFGTDPSFLGWMQ